MPSVPPPPASAVDDAVRRALAEDLEPLGDLTAAVLPAGRQASGAIVARASGVLAGRACASATFAAVDPLIELRWATDDGDHLAEGATIAEVSGPLATLLTAERTALNFLGHLSGVATLTARFVDAVDGRCVVWDTRKTVPGLRALQKAAVRAGGGRNHRGSLSEWVMVKDNHLAVVDLETAVAVARDRWPGRLVHAEADRLEQVLAALDAGVDAILLDNMTPTEVARCVAEVDAVVAATPGTRRPLLEASGGVRLDNVAEFAATGVDCISIGALTNSAPVLDIGLDLAPSGEAGTTH